MICTCLQAVPSPEQVFVAKLLQQLLFCPLEKLQTKTVPESLWMGARESRVSLQTRRGADRRLAGRTQSPPHCRTGARSSHDGLRTKAAAGAPGAMPRRSRRQTRLSRAI